MSENKVPDDELVFPEGFEVVLKIGGEGGGLTLFGKRNSDGWKFLRELVDQSAAMLDEPTIHHRSEAVTTLQEGLSLLDPYPWHRLHPLKAHPEFGAEIWSVVRQRIERDGGSALRGLGRWEAICAGGDY
jgi:hypothetical protein